MSETLGSAVQVPASGVTTVPVSPVTTVPVSVSVLLSSPLVLLSPVLVPLSTTVELSPPVVPVPLSAAVGPPLLLEQAVAGARAKIDALMKRLRLMGGGRTALVGPSPAGKLNEMQQTHDAWRRSAGQERYSSLVPREGHGLPMRRPPRR